jgi:phosphoserine phosphatase RsbU/P
VTAARTERDAVHEAILHEDPEALYHRAPCGYLSTTPDGVVVKVNDTFLRWTGYTRDELVARRSLSSLLSVGGRIHLETHFRPSLQLQGQVRELSLDIVCADGSRLPVMVNAVAEADADGHPVVIRMVLIDATERREYERELLRAKRRAEESEARARSLATTLQQVLIPPTPPRIPHLEIDAIYSPAGTGELVGGDFYDVFEIGEHDWVVALGDVCGKGVEAAAVTALVRHTLRAVTVRLPAPAAGLHELNEVLTHHPSERFCTVALLRLRRSGDAWWLDMSLGGHPPALLLRDGAPAEPLGDPGSLVGALPEAVFVNTRTALEPGTTLVLYTDGVTEARHGTEQYGEQRLRAVAEEHRGSPSLAKEVLADVQAFQGPVQRDDIAVLTITVPDS